jgi:hypothetical protein
MQALVAFVPPPPATLPLPISAVAVSPRPFSIAMLPMTIVAAVCGGLAALATVFLIIMLFLFDLPDPYETGTAEDQILEIPILHGLLGDKALSLLQQPPAAVLSSNYREPTPSFHPAPTFGPTARKNSRLSDSQPALWIPSISVSADGAQPPWPAASKFTPLTLPANAYERQLQPESCTPAPNSSIPAAAASTRDSFNLKLGLTHINQLEVPAPAASGNLISAPAAHNPRQLIPRSQLDYVHPEGAMVWSSKIPPSFIPAAAAAARDSVQLATRMSDREFPIPAASGHVSAPAAQIANLHSTQTQICNEFPEGTMVRSRKLTPTFIPAAAAAARDSVQLGMNELEFPTKSAPIAGVLQARRAASGKLQLHHPMPVAYDTVGSGSNNSGDGDGRYDFMPNSFMVRSSWAFSADGGDQSGGSGLPVVDLAQPSSLTWNFEGKA